MRPIRGYLSMTTMIEVIGIPFKFCNKTINDFETPTEDLRRVKEWTLNYINNIDNNFKRNKGIYFNGTNGVGKTFLSALILKKAYEHRYSCKRITFYSYVQQVLNVWNSRGEERETKEEQLFTNVKGVEFLVLEELGKEIESKLDTVAILEDLLRYREDKGLPTIFAANLSPGTLRQEYGESVYSLINGNCAIITIIAKDGRENYRR